MARFAERDEYQVGVLNNGLPTCTFRPKMYSRVITNIVVTNSVTSEVRCYRGAFGSVPVAQNLLGINNTLRGNIVIPAGQAFFVQWSAIGTSVQDATARVSWERDDNPLEGNPFAQGQQWATDAVNSLQVPSGVGPDEAAIVIGADLPPCMQTNYTSAIFWRPPGSISIGSPYYFEAQRSSTSLPFGNQIVDHGMLLYDGTNCGYVVMHRIQAFMSTPVDFDTLEEWGVVELSPGFGYTGPQINYTGVTFRINATSTFFVESNINWNNCTTQMDQRNVDYNSTSTAYTAVGAVFCGQDFVVPPSGKVLIHYAGKIAVSVSGNAGFLSIEIRDGNVIGSGAIVYAVNDEDAVEVANTAGNPGRAGASYLFDSGVIGNTYNVTLLHRVTGSTGSFGDRLVITQPVF